MLAAIEMGGDRKAIVRTTDGFPGNGVLKPMIQMFAKVCICVSMLQLSCGMYDLAT
jgi:hypothetical protein